MQPHLGAEPLAGNAPDGVRRPRHGRALLILWPAFAMACVLEGLVFSMVDPADLHSFGAGPLDWSRSTVYSVAFLAFWGVIAAASGLTQWLVVDDSRGGPAADAEGRQ